MHIDINFICACLACSLVILFIHSLFWDGNILGPLHSYLENKRFSAWIRKPLYTCIICMGPWYGAALYYFFIAPDLNIFFALCVSGINVIFDRLILPKKIIIDE